MIFRRCLGIGRCAAISRVTGDTKIALQALHLYLPESFLYLAIQIDLQEGQQLRSRISVVIAFPSSFPVFCSTIPFACEFPLYTIVISRAVHSSQGTGPQLNNRMNSFSSNLPRLVGMFNLIRINRTVDWKCESDLLCRR